MTYLLSVLWHFSVLKIIKFDKAVGFNFLSINHDLRSVLDCYLTSFTVHQSANLFRAHRFFRSLLPTSVIRSLLVLQITVNIADGEIGSYCFPAGNQHYAKCDLWSVICDLWFVRAKHGCMVLSSLKNRSCCPCEFFFQWFYRTKGLADTETTTTTTKNLSLSIILCNESEWTLTTFDLSKVQSSGCPHRLIGFHTMIKMTI